MPDGRDDERFDVWGGRAGDRPGFGLAVRQFECSERPILIFLIAKRRLSRRRAATNILLTPSAIPVGAW